MRCSIYILFFIGIVGCQNHFQEKWIATADSLCVTIQNQNQMMENFPQDSLQIISEKIDQHKSMLVSLIDTFMKPEMLQPFSPYFQLSDGAQQLVQQHTKTKSLVEDDILRLDALRFALKNNSTQDKDGNEINENYMAMALMQEMQHLDSLRKTIQWQHDQSIRIIEESKWLAPLIDKEIQKRREREE